MEQTNYKQLYNELLKLFEEIKNENNELKIKNDELFTHLKKYTAHNGSKTYYQKNKNVILEKNKEYVRAYKDQLPPEKIKEYNKRAYENRKNKLLNQNTEKNV
jgi:hypothetical protein